MNTKTVTKTTPKSKPPKLTAQERKDARALEQVRIEQQRLEAESAFLVQRPFVWLQILNRALRIVLSLENYEAVADKYSWWFEDFSVDSRAQSIRTNDTGNKSMVEENLDKRTADLLMNSLELALAWFDEHDAEVERQRQESILREKKRKAALEKLTDEDKAALGLK